MFTGQSYLGTCTFIPKEPRSAFQSASQIATLYFPQVPSTSCFSYQRTTWVFFDIKRRNISHEDQLLCICLSLSLAHELNLPHLQCCKCYSKFHKDLQIWSSLAANFLALWVWELFGLFGNLPYQSPIKRFKAIYRTYWCSIL